MTVPIAYPIRYDKLHIKIDDCNETNTKSTADNAIPMAMTNYDRYGTFAHNIRYDYSNTVE